MVSSIPSSMSVKAASAWGLFLSQPYPGFAVVD
jgi:hypothetical protein